MSQDQQQLSAAQSGQSQTEKVFDSNSVDTEHLVPVSEAIKYRKRAQIAEQQVEQLSQKLQEREREQETIQKRLGEVQLETELTQRLVKAGAVDIELALLLAKKKLSGGGEMDTQALVAELQKDRPILFSDSIGETAATLAGPTAGLRPQNRGGLSNLSQKARQAQQSGSRKDMQEYLRLRRSVRV